MNLAMMVICVPVKFDFDWTNRFLVRVRKQKCGRTDKRTNKRMESRNKQAISDRMNRSHI